MCDATVWTEIAKAVGYLAGAAVACVFIWAVPR